MKPFVWIAVLFFTVAVVGCTPSDSAKPGPAAQKNQKDSPQKTDPASAAKKAKAQPKEKVVRGWDFAKLPEAKRGWSFRKGTLQQTEKGVTLEMPKSGSIAVLKPKLEAEQFNVILVEAELSKRSADGTITPLTEKDGNKLAFSWALPEQNSAVADPAQPKKNPFTKEHRVVLRNSNPKNPQILKAVIKNPEWKGPLSKLMISATFKEKEAGEGATYLVTIKNIRFLK